jgi:uncharacterized membrane protein YtjA (UPF0391 family)
MMPDASRPSDDVRKLGIASTQAHNQAGRCRVLAQPIFGCGGIAAGAAGIAKILFFIFIAVFLVTLLLGAIRR